MRNDAEIFNALLEACFADSSMGLCVFDSCGQVRLVRGAAKLWAPQIGQPIDTSTLFVGLGETLEALRENDGSFELSGVSIGAEDARAFDLRVRWLTEIEAFAAVSTAATERNQLQLRVSQVVRDNRLLEQKILEQQGKIAEQAALMALFIRHVPAAVAMLDSKLDLMMLSQRWIEEFGDPALGDHPEVRGSPLRIPAVEDALRMAMDTGVTSSRVEKLSERGAVAWKRWEQTPWRKSDRSVGGSILFVEDVTNRIVGTTQLRATADNLRRVRDDLRLLTMALSRGLTEPLRQLQLHATALREAPRGTLDTATNQRLEALASRAEAIRDRAVSLRTFADLATHDGVFTTVELGLAIEMAVNERTEAIRRAGANVVLHPMLCVRGDIRLLTRLFGELIDNALRHAGGAPTVTFGCEEDGSGIVVSVTDDGPGIATHLRQPTFEPFAPSGEAAGGGRRGMGLALCRKIAELHGGAIVIDADYDLGLRVLLHLPGADIVARSN